MRQSLMTALSALLVLSAAVPAAAQPTTVFDGDVATTERLGTDDSVSTAVAISRARFADGEARYAVLSRIDAFADSLAGAPLSRGGPLLFTAPTNLLAESHDELLRVVAPGGTVYVLGGVEAVSAEIEQQLRDLGFQPIRLAGPSRVETSVAVAREVARLHPDRSRDLAIARADGPGTAAWADAVSGGAWAAAWMTPLAVTPSDSLHPAVAQLVQDLGTATAWVFGGPEALEYAVSEQLPNSQRVEGADRSATAARTAGLWPGGAGAEFTIGNGYRDDGWAFGLAAAGLAADVGAPLLYADVAGVPGPTSELAGRPCGTGPGIETLMIGGIEVLGGPVHAALDAADGSACPPPPPPSFTLQGNGIGIARFGDPMDGALSAIQGRLGAPEEDGGWEPGHSSSLGYCTYTEVRSVRWGGFHAIFVDDAAGPALSNPRLEGYLQQGGPGTLPELRTEAGLMLGATESELRQVYPQAGVDPGDEYFWPSYSVEFTDSTGSGFVWGYFNPDFSPDRVFSIISPLSCGE